MKRIAVVRRVQRVDFDRLGQAVLLGQGVKQIIRSAGRTVSRGALFQGGEIAQRIKQPVTQGPAGFARRNSIASRYGGFEGANHLLSLAALALGSQRFTEKRRGKEIERIARQPSALPFLQRSELFECHADERQRLDEPVVLRFEFDGASADGPRRHPVISERIKRVRTQRVRLAGAGEPTPAFGVVGAKTPTQVQERRIARLDLQHGVVLVALAASWCMLGWLGRWLGLRMKHGGFAPIAAVFLALVPPILLFSLVCYLSGRWNLNRMPERQFVPLMMWIAFGLWMGNCLLLSAWASARLRRDFRTTATSRFEPPPLRRSWIPGWRALVRFAAAATALVLAMVLTGFLFYAYQNRLSQRRWIAFQKEVKQRGESLELSAVMPAPVPAAQNFARAPVFQNLLSPKPAANSASQLLDRSPIDPIQQPPGNALTLRTQPRFADFDQPLKWIVPGFNPNAVKDRKTAASAVSDGLKPLQEVMAAVALGAQLPFFQVTTNHNPAAVLQSNSRELLTLQRLHFVFQLRASARLALNRETEAGEDVLTSLRLAQLARQSPDVNSSLRVQVLLASSLQPVWEGLAEHRWSDLRGLPLDSNTSQIFQQFPWWGSGPMLVSFAQTAANQAIIACALEPYRLAHGAYPGTLDQLRQAGFDRIPRDISRGRPMFYQRDDKDSYVLRGAGQNGTIDQGTVPSDDWLWTYPAPTNSAPAAATTRK